MKELVVLKPEILSTLASIDNVILRPFYGNGIWTISIRIQKRF